MALRTECGGPSQGWFRLAVGGVGQAEGLSAEGVFLMTFHLRLLLRAGHMCDSHVWVSKNSLCLGLVLM